jgi:hypothetical protein
MRDPHRVGLFDYRDIDYLAYSWVRRIDENGRN